MNIEEYQDLFDQILNGTHSEAPYDQKDYLDYTKLNASRQNRWLKTAQLQEELKEIILNIDQPQTWILITEPWCGDASHSVPFIVKLAELNEKIKLDIQLRDQPPFLIDKYLTNGKSKSIPILVVRDHQNNDLFTWGPRPQECQNLMDQLSENNADFETIKIALQNWYNENKGVDIQNELLVKLSV